ncbi:MAG: phosphonate C-P lyase system protein PhnH, partial [Raoultibacter sp.]
MTAELVEVHRIQQSFRAVMDAMARPGCLKTLKTSDREGELEKALGKPLATLVSIFVDQAVTFSVAHADAKAILETVAAETHAIPTTMDTAAFAIVSHGADELAMAD